ncbi:MAG: Crp/Fnr family transcriptional regulator [Gloeobacterales cyanobacterium]
MVPRTDSLRLLEELYQDRTLWHYKANHLIPLHKDDIWIVYRGIVQTQTLHASGDESILGLFGPIMPLARRFSTLESYTAAALTDVDLLRLSWRDVQDSPWLAMEMNQLLARRLRQTESLLALLGKRQTSERLLGFLEFLAREFGQETPKGIFLDIRLTHQQIANIVGTTRVTVTRLLGTFKKEAILTRGTGHRLCLNHGVSLSDLGLHLATSL